MQKMIRITGNLPLLQRLLSVVDILVISAMAAVAHLLVTFFRDGAFLWPWQNEYTVTVFTAGFLAFFVFSDFGLYRGWRGESYFYDLRRVTSAWSVVFLALIILGALTKTSAEHSRLWAGTWYVLGLSGLWLVRIAARSFLHRLRSRGADQKYIVIVGGGDAARAVIRTLHENPWTGYHVDGYFTNIDKDTEALHAMPVPCLGNFSDICDYVSSSGHREVWIALSSEEHPHFRTIVNHLSDLTVDTRYVPDLFNFKLLNASVSHVAGLPVVNMSHSPMHGVNKVLKSVEDKIIALAALLVLSPLLLFIAASIKLTSPGPVIFRQQRHGWHGDTFIVYKFRTMRLHKEESGIVTQARADDDRVYPLGRLLRRTSLDELPQLFNVLQGRMSIVGPRPHAVEHNIQYLGLIDNYAWRHKVKPGITGWAQVNGCRGETAELEDMAKRIEHDLYYIEHWSLWFDIKIILLTLIRGWAGKQAY